MKTARPIQKLLALMLCIAMLTAMLIPTASAETTTVDGVEYTLISTPEELAAIADGLAGKYMLKNDIVLATDPEGKSNWAPIAGFTGVLDGNGYGIYNLSLVNEAASSWADAGLFKTTEGAVIRNLTLQGNITNNYAGSVEIAAFVGQTTNTQIINCKSYVNITTGANSNRTLVGAFVANANENTTVKDCVNYGNITVNTANKRGDIGGIVGFTAKTLTIEGCVNFGTVDGAKLDHSAYVGGILGCNENNTSTVTVTKCVNLGTVRSACRYLAGIVAGHKDSKDGGTLNITYCTNYGSLESTYTSNYNIFAGGVIGRFRYNTETSVISNCFNGGVLSAVNGHAENYIGGIGGSEGKIAYTNCATVQFAGATGTTLMGYGDSATSTEGCFVIGEDTDLGAVLTNLNKGLEKPAYRINEDAIEPIYFLNAAASTVYGTQVSVVDGNGKYAVRFVGVVNALSYDAAGMIIEAKVNGTAIPAWKQPISAVYDALSTNYGMEKLAAPLGTHYMAVTMENIPASATVVFTVTPYTTVDGVDTLGEACVVTYANGAIVR